MKLVVVESPAKARTISRYLGSEYEVIASVGHIRDLPDKELGVDIENDFKPKYVTTNRKILRTDPGHFPEHNSYFKSEEQVY